MRLRHAALALTLAAGLLVGQAHALEPVNPQPATPLTYSNPAYHKITPQVAKKMMEEGNVVILDVRNPDEIQAEGKIKGSVNVPLGELRPGVKLQAAPDLNQKILVHCRSGCAPRRLLRYSSKPATRMSTTSTARCSGPTSS